MVQGTTTALYQWVVEGIKDSDVEFIVYNEFIICRNGNNAYSPPACVSGYCLDLECTYCSEWFYKLNLKTNNLP